MAELELAPPPESNEPDYKRLHAYSLVRNTDMDDEMLSEAIDTAVTACDKFPDNLEAAAQMLKQAMDTKFGPSWHAVVGEGFGFEITYEVRNLLYMFHAGCYSICLWKCA